MTFAQYIPSAVPLIITIAAGQTGYSNTSALEVLRTVGLGSVYFALNKLSKKVGHKELNETVIKIKSTTEESDEKIDKIIKPKKRLAMQSLINLSRNALVVSIGCLDFKPAIVLLSNYSNAPEWLLESILGAINSTAVASVTAGDADLQSVAINWGKNISLEVVISCIGIGTKHVAKSYIDYPYVAEFLEGFIVKLFNTGLKKVMAEPKDDKKSAPDMLIASFMAGLKSCAGEWVSLHLSGAPSFGIKVIENTVFSDMVASQISGVIKYTPGLAMDIPQHLSDLYQGK